MGKPGARIQRNRKPGWRMPSNAIYVGRAPGRAGRWGNPFRVGGAASTALAQAFRTDSWKGRQWGAAFLYAHWIAGRLEELKPEILEPARAELAAAGDPKPPTIGEIRWEMTTDRISGGAHAGTPGSNGIDLVCWCQPFVDCHADILRAVAIGHDPVAAAGTSPRWADNFRCIEEARARKRTEIAENVRRRGYVRGWTAW